MKSQGRAIFRDMTALWGGAVTAQALGFVLAIYTRGHINPREMGIWALFQTFLGFASYAGFVYDGVFREIPLARGQGDERRSKHLADVAFTFILTGAALISLLALIVGAWKRPLLDGPMIWGVVSFACLNVLMRWSNFTVGYLYAQKKFVDAGKFRTISAVANAVFVVGLVGRWGIYGFYAAMIASFLFNLWYVNRLSPMRLGFAWDGPELKRLLGISAGIGLVGAGHTLLSSLDRLVIGRILGLEALGLYTLAMMGSGYILMFSYMSTAVLYPRVLERYGKTNDKGDLLAHVKGAMTLLSILLPIGVALAWIFSPIGTRLLLPRYEGGVEALKALIVCASVMTLINQQGQLVIAFDRQLRMISSYVVGLASAVVGYAVASAQGAPLAAYAWSTTAAFVSVYALQTQIVGQGILRRRERWSRLFKTLLPTVATAVWLALSDRLFPGSGWRPTTERLVCFLPLLAGLLWGSERETGACRVMRDILCSRFRKGAEEARCS